MQIVLGGGVYARAMPLFAPIVLAYWLKAMRQASGATLIADGRSWAYSAFGAISVGSGVLLAWLLIGRYGLEGAAWGIVGGEVIAFSAQSIHAAGRGEAIFRPRAALVMAGSFVLLALVTASPIHSVGSEIALRIAYAALFAGLLLVGRAVSLADLGHATLLLRSLFPGR